MSVVRSAKFQIRQVVRHRAIHSGCDLRYRPQASPTPRSGIAPFPGGRPRTTLLSPAHRDADSEYIAYVSEQNLIPTSQMSRSPPSGVGLFEDLQEQSLPLQLRPGALTRARVGTLKRPLCDRGLCFESGLRLTYFGGAAPERSWRRDGRRWARAHRPSGLTAPCTFFCCASRPPCWRVRSDAGGISPS